MADMIEERLAELGLELPSPPKAAGSYLPVVIDKIWSMCQGKFHSNQVQFLIFSKVK